MIYLDNSATTMQKPPSVISGVYQGMRYFSANPGRSGHKLSLLASQKVFECRKSISSLFNVNDESKVVFTLNCTHALNIVIKGMLKDGDHCVISCLEHNSVVRPLEKLKRRNISYSIAQVYLGDDDKTVDSFRECINKKTKLIVCTHASNVFGIRLPVERICALAHSYGVWFCLDAAQSAGVLKIDVTEHQYDFVCAPGHKGLYGPMGTGVLIVNCDTLPNTLIEGGTGSESLNSNQPDFTPDRFESGTLNVVGINGLRYGVEFVSKIGVDNIFQKEMRHIRYMYDELKKLEDVVLFTEKPSIEYFVPVLSFSVNGINSEAVASLLSDRYHIAVRAGLHCSPLAHKYMKTEDEGVVRVSPSVFTTENDIKMLLRAINNIIFLKN